MKVTDTLKMIVESYLFSKTSDFDCSIIKFSLQKHTSSIFDLAVLSIGNTELNYLRISYRYERIMFFFHCMDFR